MRRTTARGPRAFDPVVLGGHECAAWVGYYGRDWALVLRSAVGLVREGFGLPWPASLLAAWWVLRANQAWAPFPHNDPDTAREHMRRLYRLMARVHRLPIDPAQAARREVAWWREHRVLQRERTDADETALVAALAELYAYLYSRPAPLVQEAARDRARAMRICDAWVADGCAPGDDRIGQQRRLLVDAYSRLLDVVRTGSRPGVQTPPGHTRR